MPFISGAIAAVVGIAGSIGSFIGASAIGSFLLKTAVGIGLNLLASAIAGKPEKPKFSIQGQLQTGGDLPRAFIMGWRATQGSLVYANTYGETDDTPNAFFTQVIAVSDVPIAELTAVWVNGEKCTLLWDEAVPNKGVPVKEYRWKNGQDYLWIKFHDGTQTDADPFLVNTVSTTQRPYESTRVGHGIAYVIATARIHEKLYTGFPSFTFELNGMKLYDPSKDSTVGGSGSHRWNNPSTWGGDGDHLPAVQLYNLFRGIRYNGEWFYGLQDIKAPRLPVDNWIAAIEKCRTEIQSGGETVPTYRSSVEIPVDAPLADAVEGLLTACQGRISEIGGTYKLHLGRPSETPDFIIDDDIILSTEEQSFTPFYGLSNTVNGITATYPSPEEAWNPKVAPPLYNPVFEEQDGNRRLMSDAPLDFVPYAGQVQRLMASALKEARRARRHTFVLPPEYWTTEPGDTYAFSSSKWGYDTKLFRVDGVIDRANLDVMVDITEIDPQDFDWNDATDYTPVSDGSTGPVYPPAQPMVGWQAFRATFVDEDGDGRRPSVGVGYAGRLDDIQEVEIQVRLTGTTGLVFEGTIPYGDPTENDPVETLILNGVFLPLTSYQVRGRFEPVAPNRETDWSSWLTVITPDDRFGFKDLNDTVYDLQELYGAEIREVVDELRSFAAHSASEVFSAYADRQTIRRELRSSTQDTIAQFQEEINVATGPNSALAQAVVDLNASVNGEIGGATFKMEAGYSPADGWESRIGMRARVPTEQDFNDAGLFIEARENESRILLLADSVGIATSGGEVSALFDGDTTYLNNARIKDLQAENISVGGIETENIGINQVTQTIVSQDPGGAVIGPDVGNYGIGMYNLIDYTAGAVSGAINASVTISDVDTIIGLSAYYSDDGGNSYQLIGGSAWRTFQANGTISGAIPYAFKPTSPGPWVFAFLLSREAGTGTITFAGGTHITLYHQR